MVYSNLISILKILLLLGTVSELDIFPLHNDSTYKVIVSMYFKFLILLLNQNAYFMFQVQY